MDVQTLEEFPLRTGTEKTYTETTVTDDLLCGEGAGHVDYGRQKG